MRVFLAIKSVTRFRCIKSTLFNYPKYISNVLNHNSVNVGDGVDVVLRIVRQAGARHQIQIFEDGVEAFADAVVEFA